MDIKEAGGKLTALFKKYRWPLLVIALGILLMAWPAGDRDTAEVPQIQATQPMEDPQQELAQILAQIRGVGKVQVLLTIKCGESVKYQTDEDIVSSDSGSTVRKETVIITDSDRNQQASVVQTLPPEYLGAVIVCQGAEDAAVRLAVVEAVSKATGLGADRISVLKMK